MRAAPVAHGHAMNRRQRRFQQRLTRARLKRPARIPTPLPLAMRQRASAPEPLRERVIRALLRQNAHLWGPLVLLLGVLLALKACA